MKVIKKHKVEFIFVVIFLILIGVGFLGTKKILFPDDKKELYGHRLEGIEEFDVDEIRLKKIKEEIIKENQIKEISYNLSGRVITYIIELDGDIDLIVSQSFANKLLENFNEEEKKYFDFQVYLVNDIEDSEIYPKVGYKNRTSLTFKWTN